MEGERSRREHCARLQTPCSELDPTSESLDCLVPIFAALTAQLVWQRLWAVGEEESVLCSLGSRVKAIILPVGKDGENHLYRC